ncbi:hypothetical protein N9X22_04420 [Planktomarina temperata]|nr:hypothetical protein [Planktomarina temperata]
MKTFRIAITGSSGLAEAVIRLLSCKKVNGCSCEIKSIRIGENVEFDEFDCFINLAHLNFEQVNIFFAFFEKWRTNGSKYIINISSRAAQPNISKGYLYAAQKAALNHLATNVIYNSDKECRITTINLGLIEHDLPSLKYEEIADIVEMLLTSPSHIEIPEITVQHKMNYQLVQRQKAELLKK